VAYFYALPQYSTGGTVKTTNNATLPRFEVCVLGCKSAQPYSFTNLILTWSLDPKWIIRKQADRM